MATIISKPSKDELIRHVADWLMAKALAKEGKFALCLAGGSTPKALYELLAEEPYKSGFPWGRTHVFFGDERFVAQTHPDSNFKMAWDALLSKVALPEENIHAVPDDGEPEEAAARYEADLKAYFGAEVLLSEWTLFDVTLLGLGEDGHTASLFPGTDALDERGLWATAVIGAKPEPRITLTYPVLEHSGTVAFVVTGESKRAVMAKVLGGDVTQPAARVSPRGELVWFTDLSL
jgi:6-phosphogluconolactonase